ncbi:hypothetical protein [Raineyella sp. W15-4]|uniref:hypothetical protein n=1 Tax=Raineyella sp. W15-4 TaxID=3081651 RepID=UPI0029557300|nr:hypothetical protein [Raineyella sp. W15-4]WOQ17616.1 hypothetical protein R0145_02575 [Raineyella sp. W15-4]
MVAGYRAVLHLDVDSDATAVADVQFRAWVDKLSRDRRKTVGRIEWDRSGVYVLGPHSTLTVVEDHAVGGVHSLLLEYVESNDAGVWTTRLCASADPFDARQMLVFEGDGVGPDGEPAEPATARLVRDTLRAVAATDGAVPVFSDPVALEPAEADWLADIIESDRRVTCIALAPVVPGVPIERWRAIINSLTRDSWGCASFFVLDQEATRVIASRLGVAGLARPGSLRLLTPPAGAGSWGDDRRHPVFGVDVLSRELGENGRFSEDLVRRVSEVPRRYSREVGLPHGLAVTFDSLRRERDRLTYTPLS